VTYCSKRRYMKTAEKANNTKIEARAFSFHLRVLKKCNFKQLKKLASPKNPEYLRNFFQIFKIAF
jgi:hypothetical protein